MLPGVQAGLDAAWGALVRCDPACYLLTWLNCVVQYNLFHHAC